jgi:hypothetical protein
MDMEWNVYLRTLELVAQCCTRGTQKELSLTGIGEAALHPRFVEAVTLARKTIGDKIGLLLATNGIAFREMSHGDLLELKKARIEIYVSLHRPEVAAPAIERLRAHGIPVAHNTGFADSALDWAGQVDWKVTAPSHTCDYLRKGWAVVRADGMIVSCCMDAHDLYPIGNVFDDLDSLRVQSSELCESCNLIVPGNSTAGGQKTFRLEKADA